VEDDLDKMQPVIINLIIASNYIFYFVFNHYFSSISIDMVDMVVNQVIIPS
jgi:hypothetical protein